VVEVVGRIARHPKLLHDSPGSTIPRRRERHDLVERHGVEAERERRPRAFGRVPVAPVSLGETPPDLDRRSERCVEVRRVEPDEADAGRHARDLGRPQSVAQVVEARLDDLDRPPALLARQRRREVFHDLGIGIERRVRVEVAVAPAPQHEARRLQLRRA
jgi:hypothetical protein